MTGILDRGFRLLASMPCAAYGWEAPMCCPIAGWGQTIRPSSGPGMLLRPGTRVPSRPGLRNRNGKRGVSCLRAGDNLNYEETIVSY